MMMMMMMMITATGHAIAQAVSHWLPTVVGLVQCQVWSRRICGGQSGSGVGFKGEFTVGNATLT
jgi:hypothetical protein